MSDKVKKILFVAHMDSHIANFHIPYLKWFKDQGYETHVASNSLESTKQILYCDYKHQINFLRSPFSLKNIKVYKEFKKLIKENKFCLVHAHTPMGGLIARLALRNKNIPVIYTAHGFHFLKGGSKLSWLLFYPIEKYLSKYTNELITINHEDYTLAISKFSKNCQISYVPGVGINLNEYHKIEDNQKDEIRKSLNLSKDDFVILYVAELTEGKNQSFLINMIYELKLKYNNLKLLLVGYGKEKEKYIDLIKKLNLENEVKILGYRKDILELNNIADLVVSSSKREGLPRSLLESLSIGKPLLVSNIRGNNDTVIDGVNGFLFQLDNKEMFAKCFDILYNNKETRNNFSIESQKLVKKYDLNIVLGQVGDIYRKYLKEGDKIER